MSEPLEHRLNEARRDAMLGFYLAHCISAPLKTTLRTPEDLYDYWLLDVQVSQAVPSSPVASAITSLQHYINRILGGLEPGYETQGPLPDEARAWQDSLRTYPLWSASQQLRYQPHHFLDPTLREDKSASFEQLENDLNQHRLQPATVQSAVQGYLARFEHIARLQTLNGYIDGDVRQLDTSTYYFVGKSVSDDLYYWRSLDLSKRSSANPRAPAPRAWSDWKPINLTFSADIPAHSVRPVLFNQRLFIVWAECIKPAPYHAVHGPVNDNGEDGDDDDKQRHAEWLNSRFVKLRLCFSYQKRDGSWNLPQVGLEEHCVTRGINALTPEQLKRITQTIAVVDSRSPQSLFLGIRANTLNHGGEQPGEFFQAISVDQALDVKVVASAGSPGRYKIVPGSAVALETIRLLEAYESTQNTPLQTALLGGLDEANVFSSALLPPFAHRYFGLFFDINKDSLQFKASLTDDYTEPVLTLTPEGSPQAPLKTWDFEARSQDILDADSISTTFDPITNEVVFTSKTAKRFLQTYKVTLKTRHAEASITLVTESAMHDSAMADVELSEGSAIILDSTIVSDVDVTHYAMFFKNPKTGKTFANAIYDKGSLLLTLTGQAKAAQDWRAGQDGTKNVTEYSLEGKFIAKNAFLHLYAHAQDNVLAILDRYSDYGLPGDQSSSKKLHFVNDLRLVYSSASMPIRLYRHVIMQSRLKDRPTPHAISNNTAQILNFTDSEHESLAGSAPELPVGHVTTTRIKLPSGQPSSAVTVIHGVITLESQEDGARVLGYAFKAVTCTLSHSLSVTQPARSPRISSLREESGERLEVLDFSASLKPSLPAIPLNSRLASQLFKTATAALDPPLACGFTAVDGVAAQSADFHGAHGQYLRELLIYVPWTIAHQLNRQQQYAEAERWLHGLYNPRQPHTGTLSALTAAPVELSYACMQPEQPHELALSFPRYLRKALHLLNVDILINRGDAAYRQLSPDSLAEAKLWYRQAQHLLGTRPTLTRADTWTPRALGDLASTAALAIRALEHQPEYLRSLSRQCVTFGQRAWLMDSPYLQRPLSPQQVARWDTLDARLHGLRTHLDITGKPLRPSLFAAPLAPAALLARAAHSAMGGAEAPLTTRPEVGHYRFQVIAGHAMNAVDSLAQFGATLLALIERKEQAHLLDVQQQQAWELASLVVTQHTQALAIDEKNRQALLHSRAVIKGRLDFLTQRLNEGISAGEIAAGQQYLESAAWERKVAIAGMGAGAAMLAPNIFGTAFGGMRFEGLFQGYQAFAQGEANAARANANELERTEQFNRRAQDWAHAEQQARLELAQIDALLHTQAEQEKATRLHLRSAQTALAQAQSTYQLLSTRTARAQLYEWLNTQLGTFYYALHDSAQSLCLAAEACWQYETAEQRTFFSTDSWRQAHHGLLSAEALKLNLLRMNAAYLQHTPRELEISKTVSLRHRLIECGVMVPQLSPNTLPTKTWADHKAALVQHGTLCFELTRALFDEDYPGHTLRRIKQVSLSLPGTLGPYEDIKATLTQTRNEVDSAGGGPRTEWRARQQIALSRGLDDNGQFSLDFDNDPRYLPFEYTGAVSSWRLDFPHPQRQKDLLESITDVIVHVRYTARPARSDA